MVPPAATGSAYGHALVLNDRIGARPWVARTQEDYARLLFASDDAGDRENAERLLARALATYRELGMATWAERAEALT